MATKNYKPSKARKLANLDLKHGHVISAEEFNMYIRVLATQLNQIDDYMARVYKVLGGDIPENVYDFSDDENQFEFDEADNITEAIDNAGKENVWTGDEEPDIEEYSTWFRPIGEENETEVSTLSTMSLTTEEYDSSTSVEEEEKTLYDTSKDVVCEDVNCDIGEEVVHEHKQYDDSEEVTYDYKQYY